MSTRTTCPYCGVGCGVVAQPDGTLHGDPAHPANAGRLCSKGAALGETLGLEGRLLEPHLDGARSGWGPALDRIAAAFTDTIARHGPNSVALYVSGQLLTEDYYAANKFAKGFLGTANIDSNSRLCMASAVAGHRRAFGEDIVPGIYDDLEAADLLILVGSNTAWCHPVLYQRIVAARAADPARRLVVIDPRRTATCQDADLHLPLRPGSDVALFCGLLTHLADLGQLGAHADGEAVAAARAAMPDIASVATACDLAQGDVARFFDWFAATPRAVTLFSQGVNQSSSGTDKVAAILNVHVGSGRIGKPGATAFSVTGQPNAMGGRETGALANMLAAHLEWDRPGDHALLAQFWQAPGLALRPGLKAVELFDAIGRREVRAVWIIGTNPAFSLPRAAAARAALAACDFVAVSEVSANSDTLGFAHVQLPALGWGEKDGTVTNSERMISRQRAFRPAPGQARADWWAIAQVAARMGHGAAFSWRGPADIFREHAALSGFRNDGARVFDISSLAAISDAAYDALGPTRWPCPAEGPARARLTGGAAPTRMVAVSPRPPAGRTDAEFPFLLNTGRIRDQWHGMTRTGLVPRLMAHVGEPFVAVHPDDCALTDGALARVGSREGAAVLRVRHDRGQRRGELFAPMHWTAALCAQGRINDVVNDFVDPLSGQPEFKHTPVALSPWPAGWFGFLLADTAHPSLAPWCALIAQPGGVWRHELAGPEQPEAAFARLVERLDLPASAPRLCDAHAGRFRIALLGQGILRMVLFVGPAPLLPARDWLAGRIGTAVAPGERAALLAGAPPGAGAASASVCICHGVDSAAITGAIAAGANDVAAVGAATRAGTGCGSCRPEIAALLARVPVPA